ncbi:hypothetical protein D3C75_1162640 [compost metagenome]
MELVDLHGDEAGTEQEGHQQPAVDGGHLVLVHGQHAKTEGDGAKQQQHGFGEHERQLENVLAARAAGGAVDQDCIGCEQGRKQDAVAHQVDPEAEHLGGAGIMVPILMGTVRVM